MHYWRNFDLYNIFQIFSFILDIFGWIYKILLRLLVCACYLSSKQKWFRLNSKHHKDIFLQRSIVFLIFLDCSVYNFSVTWPINSKNWKKKCIYQHKTHLSFFQYSSFSENSLVIELVEHTKYLIHTKFKWRIFIPKNYSKPNI